MVGVGCLLNVQTFQKHASMAPEVWILGGGQTADKWVPLSSHHKNCSEFFNS